MISDKKGEKIIIIVLTFCIGLFFYLGWCGFKNIQPFTHEKTKTQLNQNCEWLQIAGYCCNSQEQYNTGNCTN